MNGKVTRKEFLVGTVSASLGAVGASVIGAYAQQRPVPTTRVLRGTAAVPGGGAATGALGTVSSFPVTVPAWPWPYAKLDAEDVRKRAHKGYYDGGCAYGAFNGLVTALAAAVGDPFTALPTQMMYFGGGGGAGWGTLCGALNGAALAISIVVDRTNAGVIIGELFGWYTQVQFPSQASNDLAAAHLFLINKYDKPLKQTVSDSPLCHASVSRWCTESGFKASAAERAERCARLTGDTAAKTVGLLNDFADGKFRAQFVPAKSVTGCMSCHSSVIGNVQGGVKMDCQQCHQDNWEHLY